MLSDELKTAIKEEIEHIQVDVGLLDSYVFHPKQRDEDSWDEWSEKEVYETQKETFVMWLEHDGLAAYFGDLVDEDQEEELTEEAIKYIEEDL